MPVHWTLLFGSGGSAELLRRMSSESNANRSRKCSCGDSAHGFRTYRFISILLYASVIQPLRCQAVSGCHGVRRAKNREAARQSRLRKVLRIEALQRTVADLQAENELLLQCVQEISVKASAAQAEQRLLRVRARLA